LGETPDDLKISHRGEPGGDIGEGCGSPRDNSWGDVCRENRAKGPRLKRSVRRGGKIGTRRRIRPGPFYVEEPRPEFDYKEKDCRMEKGWLMGFVR